MRGMWWKWSSDGLHSMRTDINNGYDPQEYGKLLVLTVPKGGSLQIYH